MNKKIIEMVDQLSDEDLWSLYAQLELKLKDRKLIRTRNIVGERGEFLAITTYNKKAGLPKLQAAPEGTQNVDALSRKGERYSIKAITEPSSTTSVFYGVGNPEDKVLPEKKFEYVIIVQIDRNYMLKKMLELSWETFLKFRRWHKTMRAWNLSVTRELYKESKVIFDANGTPPAGKDSAVLASATAQNSI